MSTINVSGLIGEINPAVFNDHPHAPGFGGEIAWNDISAIKWINSKIKLYNDEFSRQHGIPLSILEEYRTKDKDTLSFTVGTVGVAGLENLSQMDAYRISLQLVPYVLPLDPSGFPSQGYNQHDHVNEFNGGTIIGAGNHTHSSGSDVGFAFSCYHPGTTTPLKTFVIEIDE